MKNGFQGQNKTRFQFLYNFHIYYYSFQNIINNSQYCSDFLEQAHISSLKRY